MSTLFHARSLTEEQLLWVPSQMETIEAIATYKTMQLLIQTQTGEMLAEIKPKGSRVILGEGFIEIAGWLGKESLILDGR